MKSTVSRAYAPESLTPDKFVSIIRELLDRLMLENGIDTYSNGRILIAGNLEVDSHRHEVRINGQPVYCSPLTFRVLHTLVAHKNMLMSLDRLIQEAWGYDSDVSRSNVKTQIAYIRKRIAGSTVQIKNVHGLGYILVTDED